MKKQELKPGMKVWCWWLNCYLWYNGKAFNAKHFEFVDAGDCMVYLSEAQVKDLERR